MYLRDLIARRKVKGRRKNPERGRPNKEVTPEGMLTLPEVLAAAADAGHPLSKYNVSFHERNERELARYPEKHVIEGFAAGLDFPLPLVAVTGLVDTGLAPDWLPELVESLVALVDAGVRPGDLLAVMDGARPALLRAAKDRLGPAHFVDGVVVHVEGGATGAGQVFDIAARVRAEHEKDRRREGKAVPPARSSVERQVAE